MAESSNPLVQRLRGYGEGGFDLDFAVLDKVTPEARKQCQDAEHAMCLAADEIERLQRELDDRRHLTSTIIEEKDRLAERLKAVTDYEYCNVKAHARLREALERYVDKCCASGCDYCRDDRALLRGADETSACICPLHGYADPKCPVHAQETSDGR